MSNELKQANALRPPERPLASSVVPELDFLTERLVWLESKLSVIETNLARPAGPVVRKSETTTQTDRARQSADSLLDVQGVAALLNCSTRHIYRLADRGLLPRPVKLGALCRWSRAAVEG